MNNLKSGGTLFLAYKGRMGCASMASTPQSLISADFLLLAALTYFLTFLDNYQT